MANNDNIIYAKFNHGCEITTNSRSQYAYGQVLKISGLHLPASFDADVSNKGDKQAKGFIGKDNELEIDDAYFLSGKDVIVMINVHAADKDGRTKYIIRIPVEKRPERADIELEPVEQDVISTAIATLNEAIEQTSASAESAENSANRAQQSAIDAETSATNASNSEALAQQYMERAETAAENAEQSETKAKASEDNAKASETHAEQIATEIEQYTERAETASTNAESSASTASQYATFASNSADIATAKASEAATSAENASRSAINATGQATIATQKAELAESHATNASNSASEAYRYERMAQSEAQSASQSASMATTARDEARTARNQAATAKTQAETAKTQAQTANTNAQSAATRASTSATSASQSATSAEESAQSALASKEAIENMSVTAQTLNPDQQATATKEVDSETGAITINYGIPKGEKGEKGDNGQDYVLTENDKQEIAQDVAELVDTDMIVTFTIPWVNGDFGEGGTADKTFTEIKTAILEGKHVIGKLYLTANNTSQFLTTLPIVTNSADTGDIITFSAYYSFGHSGDFKTINTVMTVFIGSDGTNDIIIAKQIKEIATEEYVKEYVRESINAIPDAPVEDVQINGVSVLDGGIAKIPIASTSTLGAVTCAQDYGVTVLSNGRLQTTSPSDAQLKSGSSNYRVITPTNQHKSVFYGLAKASGDTTQSESDNAVGTYTSEAKASIQSMLGVANKADVLVVTIGDVINSDNGIYQIDSTFTDISNALENGANVIVKDLNGAILPYVGKTYINSNDVFAFGISVTYGGMAVLQGYLIMQNDTAVRVNQLTTIPVNTSDLINNSLVEDVQINGTSVTTDGVAEIPIADARNKAGLFYTKDASFYFNNQGYVSIERPSDNYIKTGTDRARVPYIDQQHLVVFYGLAKAAGSDEKDSTLPVGQYTDSAKTAIKQMLDVKDDYDSLVVEVSGTDPVITGKPSYRYNCGELYTLSITPPSSGTMDIIFTSGTTPTVLTLPNTVKMPDWWAGIETNTTYEMCITDGTYCGVMSWAT